MSDSNNIDTDENMLQAFASIESIEHLRSAFLNSELAHRIEKKYKRNDKIPYFIYRALIRNSIISSACALEANINEWFSSFEDITETDSKKEQIISNLWDLGIPRTAKYSIMDKYQIALTLMEVEIFKKGENPYQNSIKLVKLRNALVHYELTFEPLSNLPNNEVYKPHSLVKDLAGLFKYNSICTDDAPIWPHKIIGSGCAMWSANTALEVIIGFQQRDIFDPPFKINKKELLVQTDDLVENTNWGGIFSNNSL